MATVDVSKKINMRNCICILFVATFVLAVKQTSLCREASLTVMHIIDLIIKMFASVGIMMAVYTILERISGYRKQMGYIGVISYELYLIHGYTLPIIKTNGTVAERLLCFIVVTAVLAIAFYIYCHKC